MIVSFGTGGLCWSSLWTLFFTDLIINFFSIYTKADGSIVTDRKKIAAKYLKTWFSVDLVASVPYTMFDYLIQNTVKEQRRYNTLLRLIRVPRVV